MLPKFRSTLGLALALFSAALAGGCARPLRGPRLRAAEIVEVPRPNRMVETNTVWADAQPITVTLHPAGNPAGSAVPVTLQAVHDRRAISILVSWPDATESDERMSWVWDPRGKGFYLLQQETDFCAIRFALEGSREACMMSGQEGQFDVWQWRGGWSHVTGLADDELMTVSRTPPEEGEASVYPLEQGSQQIFIQVRPDKGEAPYDFTERPDRRRGGDPPLGITARTPLKDTLKIPREAWFEGQDVLVEELYQGGGYTLEFYRLLETKDDEDYPLEGRGPHWLSIAVSDGREGAQHYTSDPIALYLD